MDDLRRRGPRGFQNRLILLLGRRKNFEDLTKSFFRLKKKEKELISKIPPKKEDDH